ncbi:hypothetical protein RU09_05570 [Microbacterium sp. MEJ108Y]|nr:hypothetical protein RU09_05570 [Microbacterium sp. MEJ108Y]
MCAAIDLAYRAHQGRILPGLSVLGGEYVVVAHHGPHLTVQLRGDSTSSDESTDGEFRVPKRGIEGNDHLGIEFRSGTDPHHLPRVSETEVFPIVGNLLDRLPGTA